jgi:cephalosporin-C deacetylase-like acetyl esterase
MRAMKRIAACVLLFLCASLFGQADREALEYSIKSRQQTMDALARMARGITDTASEEVRSRDAWKTVRDKRLEETREMLGLQPWPEKTPLNVRISGTLDKGDYFVEKIAFESLPRVYVTANLYRPRQLSGRMPAIVYVCGHAYSPHGNKTKYQRHGISLARNGYVALILDSIQIAETFALHHGVSSQEMYEWYSRAYSPAGVEVWNAIRAIDYLQDRPEVDPDRIGMTGRSGGAAVTWFTAAVDPRIKVAVPVMGISTYAANVPDDTQKRHCDCMFLVNYCRHDMIHLGALIAPRPLLMAHGLKDPLFPVIGFREFEEKIGRLYSDFGAADAFANLVVDTGHEDSDHLREQAIRWFDRYLLEIPDRVLDMEYVNAPEETLAVFPDGPPPDALNYRVHEDFIRSAEPPAVTTVNRWELYRNEVLEALRGKVFGSFPAAFEAPGFRTGKEIAGLQQVFFRTQPEVEARGLWSKPSEAGDQVPGLLYIASRGEDPVAIQKTLYNNRNERAVVLIFYPRGIGEISWDKSFERATLRNAMHAGHTVDSLRLWDVLVAFEALRADPGVDPARVTVAGDGVSGILGLYAAILNPAIHQVLLLNPPSSHLEGPVFLGVLRHLDLPQAAALLAPRRVNFYSRMPAGYDSLRQVYRLYGKPDHLHLTMDISAVVQGRYDHNFGSGY